MKINLSVVEVKSRLIVGSFPLIVFGSVLFGSCAKHSTPISSEEQFPNTDAEATAWIQGNCQPFHDSKLLSDHGDLAFLKDLVGDARVVALGEATHGTKEFFQTKDRILRYLVTEMGFNMFAIEATWPEANLVNDYVQTGNGDPARLLAGLYFWTWNTQEVLDMILWMRNHNENPGGAPKVSFLGFDMQYPKMAMDNAIAFLQRVDTPAMMEAISLYEAYRPYQDRSTSYGAAPETVKTICQQNLALVYESLTEHHREYASKTSEKDFAMALQSARVAVQAEAVFSGRVGGSRDQFMAENAQWLLNQGNPGSKIVLWAHNFHVGTYPGSMGGYLRSAYGRSMVVFGFDFFQGSFNAVRWSVALNMAIGGSMIQIADTPPVGSCEYGFRGVNIPRFFLDLRKSSSGGTGTGWILSSHEFRSVGAVFDPHSPMSFYYEIRLPDYFDVLIYIQDTSPSRLLPFYDTSPTTRQTSPPLIRALH